MQHLEANLRRYRHLVLATSTLFWGPTAFLFFIDRFGLTGALQLQGIYYLSVVLAEVPSGWFSDRVGRVRTLQFVGVWWVGAFSAFLASGTIATNTFLVAALGQLLLALGWAFVSGTDVTFHYDTLEALGRADRFEDDESHARRNGMVMRAVSVVTGGALGVIDLRLPFVAALIAALAVATIALRLHEPAAVSREESFAVDLASVLRLFRSRILFWLLVAVVAQVVLEHLASEFTGPYAAEVLGEDISNVDKAPLIAGLIAAVVSLVGAVAVRFAVPLRDRVGLVASLTLLAVIPTVTVATMAFVTSVWVFGLLALRNVQVGIGGVLISGVVGRTVDRHQRATFLSMTSLGGRLTYGSVLLGLSAVTGLTTTLRWAAVIATVALLAIWLTGIGATDDTPNGALANGER